MLPSSIIAQESRGTDNEILQLRIYILLKAKESRSRAKEFFKQQQEVVKRWFDKHKAGTKDFEVGTWFLNGTTRMMKRGSTRSFNSYG